MSELVINHLAKNQLACLFHTWNLIRENLSECLTLPVIHFFKNYLWAVNDTYTIFFNIPPSPCRHPYSQTCKEVATKC